MAKKIIVFLADGFEEVEAVTPIDYLRRAGIEISTVSISGAQIVTGAHKVPVSADTTLAKLASQGGLDPAAWDGVLLPGGMPGSSNLAASPEVGAVLKAFSAAGKLLCAICAAPAYVLAPLGILAGKRFTCYPGVEERVSGAKWSGERVVADGNVITSRGAGTAGEFATTVIAALAGEAKAKEVAESVLLPQSPA
jgi:4-methyl-5(b-hydroxyethyl)-thiazole monophosphate biosynthesis